MPVARAAPSTTPAPAPSPPALVLLRLAIWSVFLATVARTWADPDLWGHLRFGADILGSGIPARDPYAFTSADVWVNQSWLGDALMAAAYARGGTPGLVALKLLLGLGTLGVVAWTLHRAGVRGVVLEASVFLCLAGLYPAVPTVRPQQFSFLLFALVLATQVDEPARGSLVGVPLLFAAWANLHGAWLLGLVELGLWTATECVLAGDLRTRARLALVLVAAAAATLATPYGIGLWLGLRDTMGPSLRDVSEWRSLFETGSPALAVWIALAGLTLWMARTRGVRASRLVVLAWLAWSSWRVRRLLPFFSLATVCLLAPGLATVGRGAPAVPTGPERGSRRALRAALVVGATLLLAMNLWSTARAFACLRIDHTREADVPAADFITTNRLRGNMLTYSDWGLYAIWHFAPAVRVSMDGRRELAYAPAELARHDAIYANAATAVAAADALGADYAWLPSTLPVVPALEAHGWTRLFASPRSVVLERPHAAPHPPFVVPPARTLPPCFPADPVPAR
jgi:hypothetical protein